MRVPIIMLSGAAGSGKDTVAQFLVKNHDAVAIAQADPMKRLAADMFGFGTESLWGPSDRRNDRASAKCWNYSYVTQWLGEVLPDLDQRSEGFPSLKRWWDEMPRHSTARHILQTLGTEWGRAFSKTMWVDFALSTARMLLGGGCTYTRPQGLQIDHSTYGANLVVITDGRFRNELLAVRAAGGATVKIISPGAGLSGEAAQHSSETEQQGIPDSWFDVVLINDKAHGLKQLENVVGYMATRILRPEPWPISTWVEEEDKGVFPAWKGEP